MLLLSLLVFLFPLAVYCWVLAILNRRLSPVVVRGSWDAVGLLFGVSGFLLLVAPYILTDVFGKVVESFSLDKNVEQPLDVVRTSWLLWAIYYLLIVAILALFVWLRRNKTVIYNVDADAFPHFFQQALQHIGLDCTREGVTWHLAPARQTPALVETELSEAVTSDADGRAVRASARLPAQDAVDWPANASAEVKVDPFPAMCHVTLHWRRFDPRLRSEVEAALGRHLDDARPADNPAAGWLLGLCGFLFGLVLLITAMMLFIAYIPPRRW